MSQEDFPEHKKLRAIKDRSQVIGEFLEWLQGEKGFALATWCSHGEFLDPARFNVNQLLAEFFEIDQEKLEAEKLAMLDQMRTANKES